MEQTFTHMLLSAVFATSPTYVSTTATYQFNPSISQEEGCKRAEEKAKVVALQKVFGQEFGADSTMSCRESDTHKCDSITNTYENTRGYIREIKSRTERVNGWSCTVDMGVTVMPIKKSKSTLHADAKLDRVVYTNYDTVNLNVTTSDKGFTTVFLYDPVADRMKQVFPYPDMRGRSAYAYNTRPLDVAISAKELQERDQPYYMFVVLAGGPINMMSEYRLHDFYQMWDNQPYHDIAYVRKSFYVSRSKL